MQPDDHEQSRRDETSEAEGWELDELAPFLSRLEGRGLTPLPNPNSSWPHCGTP
jgi:hypothetical protein